MESLIVGNWTATPQLANLSDQEHLWHSHPWSTVVFGRTSASGINVTPDSALSHTPLYHGLLLLSGDAGSLEIQMKRIEGESRINVTDHVAYELASIRPHPLMCPNNFWESMVTNAVIHGNAIAEVVRDNRGRPVSSDGGGGLQILDMARTRPWFDKGGKLWIEHVEQLADGTLNERRIDPDDTYHISNLGTNGFWGRGLLSVAKDRLGNGLAIVDQHNRFMANGMMPDWLVTSPAPLDDEEFNQLISRFKRENKGTKNAGNTLVIDQDIQAQQLGMSFEAAQFAELARLDVNMVASLLGIPAVLLNSMDAATFSNVEELNQHYIQRTLRRWLNKINQELRRKLLTRLERRRFEFCHNLDPLLMGKLSERYAAYQSGITALWLRRNEVRVKEGLNPDPEMEDLIPPNTATTPLNEPPNEPGNDDESGSEPENMAQNARKIAKMLREEDQIVADACNRQKPILEWLERFYAGPFRDSLAELCPHSAADYCQGRYRLFEKFSGHVHTQKSLSSLVHAQAQTQGDRVAGLLTAEFAQ